MSRTLEFYAGVPHLKQDASFNCALAGLTRSTQGMVRSKFGGFSSLFDIKRYKYRDPLLVSTTDGVGTKLELAQLLGKHDTIGIDLVAMCVNDLITCGARPLFFLDYFASGVFDRRKTLEVIRGIAKGCREAGCALLGGETAIMPDFYADSKYDLAGFAVGIVERAKVIDGRMVRPGDLLLGLASSGFHSNGFSLLRKVFTKKELSGTIGRELLRPTRIYVEAILKLLPKVRVKAIVHITGGAFYDNVPRVLPKGLGAWIFKGSWPMGRLFREVQRRSRYTDRQMYRTFNMGIGMVLVVHPSAARTAQALLKRNRISSWLIGEIQKRSGVFIG